VFGAIGRVIAAIILVALLGGVGVAIYQAGFVAGAAADGATIVAPWVGYGWGPGPGFGLFGFLGLLLFLFIVLGLLKAVFGFGGRGRRHDGPYGWGPGWGPGWHHGPGRPDAEAFHGSPWERRAREVHEAWHRGEGEPPASGATG
jgi:hypothetical protein